MQTAIRDIDIFENMPPIQDELSWLEWYEKLSPAEKNSVNDMAGQLPRVAPNDGPQRQAYNSEADVLGYGGAAGGGKTALIALLSILEHERTVVFRFDANQLRGLVDDLIQFVGSQTGLNRQANSFYFPDRQGHMIEWGGIGKPGSEMVWRGRAHDLLCADEVTELNERKLMFLMTWMRSVLKDQRCRSLFTFNPPGSYDEDTGEIPQGRWVIPFFGPWIDDTWPEEDQAMPGELRWYMRNEAGEEVSVPDNSPREVKIGGQTKIIEPQSRTFIPATVQDNPFLSGTNYEFNLAALPSPFREQMLLGSFKDTITDHPKQLIPTKWLEAAFNRYDPRLIVGKQMSSLGVDVAKGGPRSFTVVQPRYGVIFPEHVKRPGNETPMGKDVAVLCYQSQKNYCPINVDATGVGSSAVDSMSEGGMNVVAVHSQSRTGLKWLPGKPRIYNLRTWCYWVLRVILDPELNLNVAIHPNERLKADLTSVLYNDDVHGGFILAEDKKETKKRLGRSPDEGDALIYSLVGIYKEELWSMIRDRTRSRVTKWMDSVDSEQESVYHSSVKGRGRFRNAGGWMSI